MTTTLERPAPRPASPGRDGAHRSPPPPPRPGSGPVRRTSGLAEAAAAAMVIAAALPLSQVFSTSAWVRPTLGVVLVTMGVSAAARRSRLGALAGTALATASFVLYLGVVFVPDTALAGVIPTPATLAALWALLVEGLLLLPERVSPTPVDPALALLAVGGTGIIALLVDLLMHAGQAPLKAATVALTLWVVPLAMTAPGVARPGLTAPLLAALGLVLAASAREDLLRWGRWVHAREHRIGPDGPGGGGAVVGGAAVLAGLLLASSLPGYGEPGWLQVRAGAASTLTANPIVQLRTNLVAVGDTPLFRVTSDRPTYLRTTALDRYSEAEEWTSSGITTQPLRDGIMATGPIGDGAFQVDVEIGELEGGELVPVPWQPLRASGPLAEAFQLDPRTGTVALDEGVGLSEGDSYSVLVQPPGTSIEALRSSGERMPDDPLTALPESLPEEVSELARSIVERADATTPLDQALAVQTELRSWTYSLDPPAGHDASAMLRFLEARTGYCEQFAGTMAVLLRTLDIPARVAVGFTPGRPLREGSDQLIVSWSNAHAWVEVLFPGVGWVPFEPTPRGDGNVLVPTATDPSPARLAQAPAPLSGDPQDPYGSFPGQIPGSGDVLSADELRGQIPSPAGGSGTDSGTGGTRTVGTGLGVIALLAAAGVLAIRRRRGSGADVDAAPGQRILAAGARVRRAASGLGAAPRASSTDREWLHHLTAGTRAAAPGAALATALTRARYAPSVEVDDAARAERAAGEVLDELVGSLSLRRRWTVRVRGLLAEQREVATAALAARRLKPAGSGPAPPRDRRILPRGPARRR